MTKTLKTLLVAVIVGVSLIGAATSAEAKPNPGPSTSFVTGTFSGTVITSFVCDETEPDPDDVVIEAQFQLNAKGLGKGTMHYGPKSVGSEDGSWFYTMNNGRGSLIGTAQLQFWEGAGIMTVSVTEGRGQFSGVTSGALSVMLPLTGEGDPPEDPCATIVAEHAGVISGVLNYG